MSWRGHKDIYYRLVYFKASIVTIYCLSSPTQSSHSQEAYIQVEKKQTFVGGKKVTFKKQLNGHLDASSEGQLRTLAPKETYGRYLQGYSLSSSSSWVTCHLIMRSSLAILYKRATQPPHIPAPLPVIVNTCVFTYCPFPSLKCQLCGCKPLFNSLLYLWHLVDTQ